MRLSRIIGDLREISKIRSLVWLIIFLLATSSVSLGQGGGGEKTNPKSPKNENRSVSPKKLPPSVAKSVRHGGDGVITGTISYYGPPPQRLRIDTSADPACNATALFVENLIVTNGRLANVFVYVKTGTGLDVSPSTSPSSPVILDQNRCRFVPHVLGIQKNQALQIWNSDATTHNVHFTPKNNPDWNMSQPSGGQPLTTQFHWAEVMIPVKNNQHPWMKAYVGVLTHPFFAVTHKDGTFRIEGLPPGEYTIGAWHERLGEQTIANISVGAGESKALNFTFSNSQR